MSSSAKYNERLERARRHKSKSRKLESISENSPMITITRREPVAQKDVGVKKIKKKKYVIKVVWKKTEKPIFQMKF